MSDAREFPGGFESERPTRLAGYFLISDTELRDPNFFRTVVLLTEHNEEGAFGLVVNRLSNSTLGEVLPPEVFGGSEAGDFPVYIGGPVQQEYLFLLHSGLPKDVQGEHATSPAQGVTFEPVTEQILAFLSSDWPEMAEEDRPNMRVYGGYSGWGAAQLEGELDAGAWIIHRATEEIVFHPHPEKSWAEAMSKKGPLYRIIAQTGFKPSMN